jgi:teichuronic acid biosynthesis glycosyltransferase TuaG
LKKCEYGEGVSVIIPFYNGNRYINEAIRSVVSQNTACGLIEVVLCVDHGSEMPEIDPGLAGSVEIVRNDLSESGAGVARFVAIQSARMRYLAFLDADDLWTPDKLEKQLAFMNDHGYAFCFGGYSEFSGDDTVGVYVPSGPYDLKRFLRKVFTIGCLTVVVDRKYGLPVRKSGLRRRNDYFMWYHMLKDCEMRSLPWGALPEVIGRRRLHADNLTRGNLHNLVYAFRFYRAIDVSLMWALALTLSNAVQSVLRKTVSKLNR